MSLPLVFSSATIRTPSPPIDTNLYVGLQFSIRCRSYRIIAVKRASLTSNEQFRFHIHLQVNTWDYRSYETTIIRFQPDTIYHMFRIQHLLWTDRPIGIYREYQIINPEKNPGTEQTFYWKEK